MSDFIHFVYWFSCVLGSALCVAAFAWDHWYFQSAAMSLLLPLCLSLTLGSFLFLGFWKLRVGRHSDASFMQSDSMVRVSQTNRAATRNANLRPTRVVLD